MSFNPSRLRVALLAAALVVAAAPGAAAKDYFFPDVRIAVQVERDGTLRVEERRTYEFSGSFSWADLSIPRFFDRNGTSYAVEIGDFSVADESGTPLRAETDVSGGSFKAKWGYAARDERRTFVIRYRLKGAVLSYPDVTDLYWKAIGDAWIKPTARAEVTVVLPEPLASPSDMLVYGHGPLSGRSEIVDARTARFTATDIPAGQFLEIRMAWPAGLVAGVASQGMDRESIKAEEARFVRQTIEDGARARTAASDRGRKVKTWLIVYFVWYVAGSLLFLAFYIPAWRKTGREYDVPDAPEYVHEPPSELPPALVEHLRSQGGTTTPRAFTATLFDLARRGRLVIEDRKIEKTGLFGTREKVETILTLTAPDKVPGARAAREPLRPFEQDALDLVFGEAAGGRDRADGGLTVDELKSWLIKHASEFQTWFKAWSKSVKEEGKALGFLEPESLKRRKTFGLAFIPLALLTFNIPLILLAGALVPKLARRTRAWNEEDAKWRGLERFLKDFGEFKDLPPQAYVLWERYLVFGILFGQTRRILKALPILLQDPRAPAPYWYLGLHHGSLAGFTAMTGSLESAVSTIEHASSQASHYSSGGGGGFSGGGGGGAGGGGGGAG